jgi:hypothetical protein
LHEKFKGRIYLVKDHFEFNLHDNLLSANSTGILVYIMGAEDKKYLTETYGKELGKASVTGYCIKFKTLKNINMEVLETAIRNRFESRN